MSTLTIPMPDDLHLHVRDNDMLRAIGPASTAHCARGVIMPNLTPPVVSRDALVSYEARVRAACPGFEPLMTLYLTDDTTPADIHACAAVPSFVGAKLYPAHATTNSHFGVTDVKRIAPALDALAEVGRLLLVHGEVTDPAVDIFDREAVFIELVLAPLIARHPRLRVVLEHITTRAAVDFVQDGPETLGASITAHHLWQNRNALFAGGLRPHAYCLPVLKREADRQALVAAATQGASRFFYGTDSAPHVVAKKEADCGCAGVFSAPTALATVLEVFAAADALDHLAAFTSENGARFYGLPPNEQALTCTPVPHTAPMAVDTAEGPVRVFRAGETLAWTIGAGDGTPGQLP